MRKFLFILLFVPLCWVQAQVSYMPVVSSYYDTTSVAGGAASFSDDFDSYTDAAALNSQGLWLTELNNIYVTKPSGDGAVYSNSSSQETAAYYNSVVDGNQFSAGTYESASSGIGIGPAVRCQGGTGTYYGWYSTTTQSYLTRQLSGVETILATGTAWSATDIVKLEIVGYELKCYRGGVLDTSVSGDGKFTDTSGDKLDGGFVGICGWSNNVANRFDDWSGGDL